MKTLLYVIGALQIVGSILVAIMSKSAIHDILATAGFGFGVLSLGFGAVIGRLDEMLPIKPKSAAEQALDENHATVTVMKARGWSTR